ncbi:putative anti-sigma factor [Pedobacter sp. BAL39]|uniref:FecR family protein n=1 Tax=Pedobacter sp. BAL39 TaxID=391596 RepID=UPI000155AA2D|nr:FecR domain-containing protein [Pedobacter sp. BAL39]EDM34176.1 putative anti-sigma factor [Pedobacter sp. BAL39]
MNNIESANYSSFETLDFFTDEHFIRYVLHSEDADRAYWQQVMLSYPDKLNAMEEAEAWVLMLNRQPLYQGNTPREEIWDKVSSKIGKHNHVQRTYVVPLKRAARWLSGIAALILLYFSITEVMQFGRQTFQSHYGELRSVIFPDESVAMLNANSKIYYHRDWRSDKPRELWLEGEASFKVKHVAIKNRFQEADSFKVHVNGLELTVLGTQFNVKDRRGETEISLIEGSLRIDKKDGKGFSRIMKPGDVFRYDGHQLLKTDHQRAANASISWTRKELELQGYALQDVLNVLEDTYGYKITMHAPELAAKRLSGVIPLTNDQDIIFVMEKVFKISVTRRNRELIIDKAKQE